MADIFSAEEARNKVEDMSILTDEDHSLLQNRIEDAIKFGNRTTSVVFTKENGRKFWASKCLLSSLGYKTLTRDRLNGERQLVWEW